MQIGAFKSNVFGRQSKFVGDQDFSSSVKPKSGSQSVGDGSTVVETDLGNGLQVETKVDTRTNTGGGADEWRKKYEQIPQDDSTTDQPTEDQPKFKINPLILVGVGIAAYLFFKKRK